MNSKLSESISLLFALILFVAFPTSCCALEPFLTGTQEDKELKRPAEDRDYMVGDVAVTAGNHAEKGWTYFNKKKDVRSALRHFEAAIKLWPDTAQAVLGKAYCLNALGRKEEAARVLSECKCRNQITPDVISLAEIDLLIELKQCQEALRVCDRMAAEPTGGGLVGYWVPTFSDLIPRSKVLLAMGDKNGALRVANQMYLFGIGNPYAKNKAIEIFEQCGVSPPTKAPDTSAARSQVHSILATLITDSSWMDQQSLEKVLGHKLAFNRTNASYGFDDRSGSTIGSALLRMKSQSQDAPSLTITLNFPVSLVTFDDLKQWFPKLVFHPAIMSGCCYTGAFSDFSEGGNRIGFDRASASEDPAEIVTRFTLARDR